MKKKEQEVFDTQKLDAESLEKSSGGVIETRPTNPKPDMMVPGHPDYPELQLTKEE